MKFDCKHCGELYESRVAQAERFITELNQLRASLAAAEAERDHWREAHERHCGAISPCVFEEVTDGMARQWSEDSKAHAATMLERDAIAAHLNAVTAEREVAVKLTEVMQARLERFEDLEEDARALAEWANTISIEGSIIRGRARRYLSGIANRLAIAPDDKEKP
jgi:uncharacterized coiled-coil protein SlyX